MKSCCNEKFAFYCSNFSCLEETLIISSIFIISIFVSTKNIKLSRTISFLQLISVYKSLNYVQWKLHICVSLCAPNKKFSSKSYRKLKINIKLTDVIAKLVQKEVLARQWLQIADDRDVPNNCS